MTARSLATAKAARPADDARIRAVIGTHHALAWRVVRRLGVPAADAEDAVQRVFLVVVRRLDDIEHGSERAFIVSAALRVAADTRRGAARKPLELFSELDDAPDPVALPDELVESYRARRLFDAILEDMSDDVRSVFVLFEIEELTFSEISSVLSIPRGTVASRLARARRWFTAEVARREGTPRRKDDLR